MKHYSLCIIIPCYNEESRLPRKFFETFDKHDILLVNDGSSDGTALALEELVRHNHHITSLSLASNQGKAAAIRHGVLHVNDTYSHIAYLDADLSTSLEELDRLYRICCKEQKDIVMGSRLKISGSEINRRTKRHVLGRIIATIIDECILKMGIYDTQCGAKVFPYSIAKELFSQEFISRWLFDVELLKRYLKRSGRSQFRQQVLEVPLKQWSDVGQSKITFRDTLQLPFELYKIARAS